MAKNIERKLVLTAEFAKRLNTACDRVGAPQNKTYRSGRWRWLAERLGAPGRKGERRVGNWLTGKCMPHPSDIQDIAKKLDCNFDWLVSGLGYPDADSRINGDLLPTCLQVVKETFPELPAKKQKNLASRLCKKLQVLL